MKLLKLFRKSFHRFRTLCSLFHTLAVNDTLGRFKDKFMCLCILGVVFMPTINKLIMLGSGILLYIFSDWTFHIVIPNSFENFCQC